MNSFRIVESFQIFKNQLVCLLIVANFKAIEPFIFGNQRSEFGITVKGAGRKAGNLLDGFADADAEARQNLPDLPVGVYAWKGNLSIAGRNIFRFFTLFKNRSRYRGCRAQERSRFRRSQAGAEPGSSTPAE